MKDYIYRYICINARHLTIEMLAFLTRVRFRDHSFLEGKEINAVPEEQKQGEGKDVKQDESENLLQVMDQQPNRQLQLF